MDDWTETVQVNPPPDADGVPTPITALGFDTVQDLLWTGHRNGRVTSFVAPTFNRYTSYMSHPTSEGPVKQLLFNEKGIISLGPTNLHMAIRRGLPLWNLHRPELGMKGMECMAVTPKGSEVLIAGSSLTMVLVDIQKPQGQVVRQMPTEKKYVFLKTSTRYLVAATKSGLVDLLDPSSFAVVKSWAPHSGMLADVCVNSEYIISCGYTLRGNNNYMLDGLLNIFELRPMNSRVPFPFAPGPLQICPHGNQPSIIFVLSQHGQLQMIDLLGHRKTVVKQADLPSPPACMELAPTSQAVALVPEDGLRVHIWSSPNDHVRYSNLAQPVEWPNSFPRTQSKAEWTPETPLGMVGMPYYREELLSNWPNMWHLRGRPPPRFDSSFLAQLQPGDGYSYGPNIRGMHRNQVEPSQLVMRSATSEESKYLSQPEHAEDDEDNKDPYRLLSIQFSKFGFADFDFGFFNKTVFSGLTNHLGNSFVNPLLQLLRFTPVVRNIALEHLAGSCINDSCVLCELGFLFDMMEKAEGSICQATNLLRTLAHDSKGTPQSWFLPQDAFDKTPQSDTLQSLARFLMERIVMESKEAAAGDVHPAKVLSTVATNYQRCSSCKKQIARSAETVVTELMYPTTPPQPASRGQAPGKTTFSQIFKTSVERDTTTKGWCAECKRYHMISTRRHIHGLPETFLLNAAANTPERKQLWATPGWLPAEIGVIVNGPHCFCYEGEDLKLHLSRNVHKVVVYSLVGVTCLVDGRHAHEQPHLVASVNASISQPNPQAEGQWVLLNDFLVQPISEDEARTFNQYRTPAVVCYQVQRKNHIIDDSWKTSLDTSLLFTDSNTNSLKPYRVLNGQSEVPKEGTIVALDSEFVSVGEEGIAISGVNDIAKVNRPSPKTVARLSVLRGDGMEWGEPFIDDYIKPKEVVVNYLTAYSGITAEDLDPRRTKRHLVPLKVAIKKLWILLNLGCRFVGHGLENDFRELNITVPKSQRIDTLELFGSPTRRRLVGLSFLCWFVLREHIQQTTHDSIEDAKTALRLYEKYREFKDAGVLARVVEDLFTKGQKLNFRIPKTQGGGAGKTTPPPSGSSVLLPVTPVRNTDGHGQSMPGTPWSPMS